MEISNNKSLKSDTPKGINDLSFEEILPYAVSSDAIKLSPKVRLNYIRMLYDVLGYDLSPDIALAAISEPTSTLALATAGGGKTTWAQIKAIMQKLIRPSRKNPNVKIKGDSILCLVYNKHNVPDIQNKHKQMVARLNAANIKGLNIDSDINACTMHSFCEFWRKEYVAKMNLVNYKLLPDNMALTMMNRAISIACKKLSEGDPNQINGGKVLELYNLARETMRDVEELQETDKFSDLGLSVDLVKTIFERYEAAKRIHKRYDFVDMLLKFYELLKSDESALARVQRYYEYVIADEVQDFTPLMWEILRLMVSNGTPLTCIGDDDQSIYYFRGTNVNDLLQFQDKFIDGHVYLLSKNRRCRKVILDEARCIIQNNTLRFDKELLGYKDGGKINFVPYNSTEGQIIHLVQQLEKKDINELRDTVVCYRETSCSMLLAELLEEHNIPFNVISGYLPFQHELYRHVTNILDLLEMPCDRALMINLYKVLPCSRSDLFEILQYNPENGSFKGDDPKIHFSQYYYGKLIHTAGFVDAMELLIDLSNKISSQPLSVIFDGVFALLKKYFWIFKKTQNSNLELDEIMEERVKRTFSVDIKYSQFFKEFQQRKTICRKNNEIREGVTISTFHSLKGLEFSTVYAIFLDNDIFPNYSLIDARNYSPEVTKALKECETRLWYVAVTRAKDELIIYYKNDNPSIYVVDAMSRAKKTSEPTCAKIISQSQLASDDFVDEFIDDIDTAGDISTTEFIDDFLDEPLIPNAECTSEVKEDTDLDSSEVKDLQSFGCEPEKDNIDSKSMNTYLSKLLSSL